MEGVGPISIMVAGSAGSGMVLVGGAAAPPSALGLSPNPDVITAATTISFCVCLCQGTVV